MEDCTWQLITEHARKCIVPVKKVYAYSTAYTTIYINSVYDLIKVAFGGVECPRQQLDKAQKVSPSSNRYCYFLSGLISFVKFLFYRCLYFVYFFRYKLFAFVPFS